MVNKIKKKLKSNKGQVSIIAVVLLLIGMTILFSMYDFSNRTWVFQEIKGIMESVGTTTLTEVIDKDYLKDEKFSVQANNDSLVIDTTDWNEKTFSLSSAVQQKIKSTYQQKLEQQALSGGPVVGTNILHLDTYVRYDEWGTGTTTSGKSRAYIILSSVVAIDVKMSQTYDAPLQLHSGTFSDYVNGGTFEVENVTSVDSETMRVVVRSDVRVVYR